MRAKDRTQTEVIRTREIEADGAKYLYELIMKKSKRVASYRLPLYSISVRMTDRDGNETDARITDVFSDIGKAMVFFQKIVDNLVTPIDLPYIFEDQILI